MKARGLIIGALIKAKSGAVGKVIHLTHCTINAMPEDLFEPIPLTPEILEKNGFYVFKSKTSSYCEILLNINISDDTQFQISGRSVDGKWYMSIYKIKRLDHKGNNDSNCLWSSGLPFEYKEICVHELQLALLLCGLSELAYNFKVK